MYCPRSSALVVDTQNISTKRLGIEAGNEKRGLAEYKCFRLGQDQTRKEMRVCAYSRRTAPEKSEGFVAFFNECEL
jgi:hypothetical protein